MKTKLNKQRVVEALNLMDKILAGKSPDITNTRKLIKDLLTYLENTY